MKSIKCPKCGDEVVIDIAQCVDELGEVHMCNHCGFKFRYIEK